MDNIKINKNDFELLLNSNIEEKLNFEELKFLKNKINNEELIFSKNVYNNIPNIEELKPGDYEESDNYEIEEFIFIDDKYKVNYYNSEQYEDCYNKHDVSTLYYKERLFAEFYFVIENIETKEVSLFAGYFKENNLDFIFFKNIIFGEHHIRFSYIQDYSEYNNVYKKRLLFSYYTTNDLTYDYHININLSNLSNRHENEITFKANYYSLLKLFADIINYNPMEEQKYFVELIKQLEEYKELNEIIKNNFYYLLSLIDDNKINIVKHMIDNFEEYYE